MRPSRVGGVLAQRLDHRVSTPLAARLARRGTQGCALALGAIAVFLLDCAQTPTSVPLRSLERSGKASLICLDPAEGVANPGYSLEDCQASKFALKPDGSGAVLQLFALVNQTTRGEVAVLDILNDVVVDSDPASPGFNFLPVGAQPVDLATTPGGTASFVATAEAGRPAIYALPSGFIRKGAPTIRSWPACVLPAAPGAMTMLVSSADAAAADGSACPSPAVGAVSTPEDTSHPFGDLAQETSHPGVRKLVVTLPSEGEVLVIDAQRLLDRPQGSFDLCPIDRRIKLRVDLPESQVLSGAPSTNLCPRPPEITPSPVCPSRTPQTTTFSGDFEPFPSEIALSESRLYIADEGAPVIHELDLTDPCNPVENDPLLPSSYDQPWRPVFTRGLAVSPVTSDNKRFVYAIDADNGSTMVFDISEGSARREPRVRDRPDLFPFSSPDRLDLGSPVRAITFVKRDLPYQDTAGALVSGIKCDPAAATTAPEGVYQARSDFSAGAAPSVLRGVFALAALTSGAIYVVDVDDLDQDCRGYGPARAAANGNTFPSWVTGCDTVQRTEIQNKVEVQVCVEPDPNAVINISGEGSCRVVVPHEVRSRYFFTNTNQTGPHLPSFQSFPSLSLKGSTLKTDSSDEGKLNPKLLGPDPQDGTAEWHLNKGGTELVLPASPSSAEQNFVIPDLRDPRTAIDQDWSVTYEGVIPGFEGRVAKLNLSDDRPEARGVFDSSGYFCYRGAQDRDAALRVGTRLLGSRAAAGKAEEFADTHADAVEITSDLLVEEDSYWAQAAPECSYQACLQTFGQSDTPSKNRFFPISEAYNDRVLVKEKPAIVDGTDPAGKRIIRPECCFPTVVTYRLRARQTWVVNGSVSGFLNNGTIAANGRCVEGGYDLDSGVLCDTTAKTRTGRAYELPPTQTSAVKYRPELDREPAPDKAGLTPDELASRYVFHNAHLFFAIYPGTPIRDENGNLVTSSQRDMTFTWRMSGGFVPLAISVARGTVQVAPEAMLSHPVLGSQLLVTDAAQQGVVMIDLDQLAVSKTFF
jgi:hypothetical protein